jgi:hypothetical protein
MCFVCVFHYVLYVPDFILSRRVPDEPNTPIFTPFYYITIIHIHSFNYTNIPIYIPMHQSMYHSLMKLPSGMSTGMYLLCHGADGKITIPHE